MKSFILICFLGLSHLMPTSSSQQAQSILDNMHAQLNGVSAHSYRLQLEERRMDNTYHKGQMLIRVQQRPLKVWAELLEPNKGPLVEYNEALDRDEATVTPKKWLPALKIKGDIHGEMLRKGHYAINETSLNYIDQIIKRSEAYFQARGAYERSVRLSGNMQLQGKFCHKIELIDHEYGIKNYRVKKGENLISIAQKLLIHPYKVRELNPRIESYYELSEGDIIKVPSSYGKRCVVYVDAQEFLPRRMEVHDENGRFEVYNFHDLQIKK